ncbi:uncharacterized protein P884DRAFT_88119 [Thermothelomyces heterothallicus CBS 202.75]|uniref:uncharacterized protein n=1 Tax=Thermothelomyces heterothallicus CBS 202.75 TaxID=1149848 RepID=UPI0037428F8B
MTINNRPLLFLSLIYSGASSARHHQRGSCSPSAIMTWDLGRSARFPRLVQETSWLLGDVNRRPAGLDRGTGNKSKKRSESVGYKNLVCPAEGAYTCARPRSRGVHDIM